MERASSSPPAWAFGAMTVAALLGLGASATAAYVHHRLLTDPAYASFCDVNATFNCTNAYLSAYGTVAGVPTAMLGVMYFGAVLLGLALWRLLPRADEGAAGFVFAMALAGLPVVAYLAYASYALGSLCLVCVATYVAVILMFAVSARAARSSMSSLVSRLFADLSALVRQPSALAAIAAFLVASVVAVRWFPAETPVQAAAETGDQAAGAASASVPGLTPPQQQELEKFLSAQQRVPVMVATEGAAVVLVKFNDYMCPPCGQTFAEYKPVVAKWTKEYPGKLKYVTKDFPLDPECNKYAPAGSHMASCEAAVAVRLARERGKAQPMEDWLFANQPTLTTASVKDAARVIGGVPDFDARYTTTLQLVRGDIEQAAQLTVQGTPTFFLNGIRLPGLRAAFLDAAIALEMKRAGVAVR